ncbi:general odorant-binding protein 67 [Drosophila virilis]|uniref:Odorant-binding protein 49a n=1 Tax=Drosophila virilis TaxID=7244 RepID=B4MFN8_DROVI|nr:general odorant-binding protein 68 [Drosophila virilis]EDW57209.1 Odorant-binding protein 49a [Drosophila virilis]
MLSKYQQLLLVIVGLCLSVAHADVDCSQRPKFVNPMTCCPMPEFVTAELKEKCQQYNITPPSPPPMSTEQQSGEGRRPHPHHHFLPPCFVSCVFNETGIYEDNSLDADKLKDYLSIVFKDSEDLQTVASDAFTTCAAKVDERQDKMGNRPRPSPPPGMPLCPHKPAFLLGCVFKNMMKNCPASVWTDTQECNETREFFKSCKPPHRRQATAA